MNYTKNVEVKTQTELGNDHCRSNIEFEKRMNEIIEKMQTKKQRAIAERTQLWKEVPGNNRDKLNRPARKN